MTQDHLRDHDTSYYKSYPSLITGRLYLSRKYNVLSFQPADLASFQYRATTSLNIGIGATYHAFTLNIGIGITRFNPDSEKGKTRYLDMQGHFYARKWNVDLLGEIYKGYYLTPQGEASQPGRIYYLRPDIGLSLFGFAFYRALNNERFSYRAGLLQNEWQNKSAGSFLYGGEIYYGAIHGDSSLSPSLIDQKVNKLRIDKFHFLHFGPGIGYAYTLVYEEHWFLLGSATINFALSYSTEISTALNLRVNRFGFKPDYIFHLGTGYNSNRWNVSLLWVDTTLPEKGRNSGYAYSVNVGNYRLIYARRMSINHKIKKLLEPVPN